MAEENKSIKFADRVTVYSTEKDPYRKTNESYKVHPEQAKALIDSGKASDKPIKPGKNTTTTE